MSDFTGRLLYFFYCLVFNFIEKLNILVTTSALEGGDYYIKEALSSCIIQGLAISIILVFLVLIDSIKVTMLSIFSL